MQNKNTKFYLARKKSIIALIVVGLIITTIISTRTYEAQATTERSSISGLNEGDQVTYRLFEEKTATPHTMQITADTQGEVTLPTIQAGKNTALNLDIESENERKSIMIRFNPDKEEYEITAEGLQSFEKVEYGTGTITHETKADWAGILKGAGLKQNPDNGKIELAFSGFMGDIAEPANPLKINISLSSDSLREHDEPYPNQQAIVDLLILEIPNDQKGQIKSNIESEDHKRYFVANFVKPLMMMTEQLSAVMLQHSLIIGTFFDAKEQLEAQRDMQELQAEAHRDYHPSEQMCVIGTFSRSLNSAESHADYNKTAFNEMMMKRLNNSEGTAAASGHEVRERIAKYQERYCDPSDHNRGLSPLCETASDKLRTNKDIDFSRTLIDPLTLDINFSNPEETPTEQDIIELGKNLYMFNAPNPIDSKTAENQYSNVLNTRRLMAMQNVAQTSLSALIGAKAEAHESGTGNNGAIFMKRLVGTLLPDDDPDAPTPTDILGEDPSYYAMMEMLTKKMYQDPHFYTNLYDKPANVERIKASLKAIQLMHNRDRYESTLRREMLSSMLLETALMKEQIRTESTLNQIITAGEFAY